MKKKEQNKRRKNRSSTWLMFVAIAVFAAAAWFVFRSSETPSPQNQQTVAQNAAADMPNKYATLSPSMFTGRAREAYQAARDIPEVLKQVQCYCGCKRSAGHQSNLDCFTDDHGFG